MKRLVSLAAIALLAGFAFAADAVDNPYAQDFTTGMGSWELSKAEGKADATGLKITKTEELGGIGIDANKKADLSAYKTCDVTFVNNDTKDLQVVMKIGSGVKDKRTDKPVTVPQGEKTVSFKLSGEPVDLSNITYLRFWFEDAGEHNVIIKKIAFGPAPAAATPAATEPAK